MDKIATIKQILMKAIYACDLSGLSEVQGVVITRKDALMIISLLTEIELEQKNDLVQQQYIVVTILKGDKK